MSDKVEITASPNGPLLVSGDIQITDYDKTKVKTSSGTVALCRCGASKNKPFCDGSHFSVNFDGTLNAANTESTTPESK